MYRMVIVFLAAAIGVAASEPTIALSGTVSGKTSNKPIAGAIVTIAGKMMADTTNANGSYSITTSLPVKPFPVLPNTDGISLNNGIIFINLMKPAPVRIELFDMKGSLLEKVFDHPSSSGDYKFDLMSHPLAANMLIIRASIGQRTSTFRYLPLNNGKYASAISFAALATPGKLAKIQVTVDSLKAWAPGYKTEGKPLSSYEGVVNISLDTINLPRFSFFVTSLKAIRELSGNPMGFGGDLRFGKTGPGAGLLGADSICQCIAEKSMQGSKAKIWRAFLSVAKDANGKQVNAIDRIGRGPWYDRVGRLVAQTVEDLKQNRPVNIHEAIKDDLPNENGVPNHRPDANLPEVDNHLTVTGSDSTGKLYSATSTCEDWTTASATSNSKPRCGLSWTREGGIFPWGGGMGGGGIGGGMGGGGGMWPIDTTGGFQMMMNMENWISTWDLPGCVAGIDSTDLSGPGDPTKKYIGAGGGYGGFYCFALNP